MLTKRLQLILPFSVCRWYIVHKIGLASSRYRLVLQFFNSEFCTIISESRYGVFNQPFPELNSLLSLIEEPLYGVNVRKLFKYVRFCLAGNSYINLSATFNCVWSLVAFVNPYQYNCFIWLPVPFACERTNGHFRE